jgi:hypothetical protein
LIIPLIIQTIARVPSQPVAIDEAPNVSRADPSRASQFDAEHQATDMAVGGSIPRGAPPSLRLRVPIARSPAAVT